MLLTVIAYAMIVVFMYVIMTKKLSPFTSLVMIPLLFAIIAMVAGVANKGTIGDFVLKGLTTTANTGIMLLFAILYFSTWIIHLGIWYMKSHLAGLKATFGALRILTERRSW
ncbi:Mg++/citrate complex transporter [Lacticaseibacillus paracasei]|nr:Mg++/citrate complex transporter [Lacticaseibacillus paracasei]